jgi:MvaI/BcnI restriction endonuclease family
MKGLPKNASDLLGKLSELANRGPIPAVGHGSTAIGMTLLHALGVQYSSTDKFKYAGIVVSARRDQPLLAPTRVNLFARVPDWEISAVKSSREIVERYGYDDGPAGKKLYCTVRAGRRNSQGLSLRLDHQRGVLEEVSTNSSGQDVVARWRLIDLRKRLLETHPATMWVSAKVLSRDGVEYFHYRNASYCGPPLDADLASLIEAGTVTVDHLITSGPSGTKEKGPLFKILPENFALLFPSPILIDLLAMDAT